MNFRTRSQAEKPGFQIAPMIDVVFLLLCFFISSQVFSQWETEISIELPTASTRDAQGLLPGEIVVNVLKDGSIVVNAKALDVDGLSSVLARLVEHFADLTILIRADRTTAYEHVIRVIDRCRQAGITNISFATNLEDGE